MNNLRFPRCPVTSRWLPTPPPLLSMPVPSFLCLSSGFNSDPSTKLGVIVMYTHRYHRTVPGTESTKNVVAVLNTAIITLSPGFSTLTLLTLNYRYIILWCGSGPVNCRMLNGISGLYSAGCQWHPPHPPPSSDSDKHFRTFPNVSWGTELAWLRITACALDGLSSDPQPTGCMSLEAEIYSASVTPMPGT